MTQSAHSITQQSYARCLRSPDFFERFYEIMLASDPAIPPMFANTDFPRQRQLLKHGLGLLMSYGNQRDDALLERLAARHSRAAIDVPPDLYSCFVDSLVAVVSERDPKFDGEIEEAWREIVEPGIKFMSGHYES